MSSKRQSAMPPGPKTPVSFSSTVTISDSCTLTGTNLITIYDQTVIHPRARLISIYAPLAIGKACIISERVVLGPQTAPSPPLQKIEIGNGTMIEVGAVVEAAKLGEGCLIEVNARVGKGAVLGKHCRIGPLCTVAEGEILPDYTVVYGDGLRRVDRSGVDDLKMKMVSRQADVLRKLVASNPSKFL